MSTNETFKVLLLFNYSVMLDSLWLHGLKHARLPCPSPSPGACSNSCSMSQWCHPTISSSCLQSFPASGSFQMSQFFAAGAKVLELHFSVSPSNEYTVLISFRIGWFDLLGSKGLLRVFSSTMVKASILYHSAFFIIQLSHPYMTAGKTIALTIWTFVSKHLLSYADS